MNRRDFVKMVGTICLMPSIDIKKEEKVKSVTIEQYFDCDVFGDLSKSYVNKIHIEYEYHTKHFTYSYYSFIHEHISISTIDKSSNDFTIDNDVGTLSWNGTRLQFFGLKQT